MDVKIKKKTSWRFNLIAIYAFTICESKGWHKKKESKIYRTLKLLERLESGHQTYNLFAYLGLLAKCNLRFHLQTSKTI